MDPPFFIRRFFVREPHITDPRDPDQSFLPSFTYVLFFTARLLWGQPPLICEIIDKNELFVKTFPLIFLIRLIPTV